VAAGGLAIAVGLLTLSAVLFLVPQYLQSVLGASAIVTGLLLVPFGVAFTAVALVANRIALRYGLRNVLLGALLTCAAGTLVLLGIAEAVAAVVIVVGTTIFGAGAASMVPNATTAVMNAVPTDKAGDGSAVNQITRQLGAVLGVALAGTVLADVYASKLEPALSALRQADAAVASASITGAQSVAAGLSSGSAALLEAADVAFVTGFRFALLVPVACCLIAAAVVAVVLRSADADDASQTQFDPGA
jgi:predicted MFS family arabinose efflux permease